MVYVFGEDLSLRFDVWVSDFGFQVLFFWWFGVGIYRAFGFQALGRGFNP